LKKKSIIVAVTGASGAIYAKLCIETLHKNEYPLEIIFSETGKQVFEYELGIKTAEFLKNVNATVYGEKDFFAPPSSGSHPSQGMIIIPCSTGTLGHIANCTVSNLIHRAADVTLKEKRPLVLVVRETPLNSIHLENMLKLSRAGATILPACPSFYNKPQTMKDLVATVVERALRHLTGKSFNLSKNWK